MVEFELRHYAESYRLLVEALSSKVKPLDARQRTETEALLARTSRYLGEIGITTEPAFATVLIDGATFDVKANPTLQLEVGEHTIEVRAGEYLTQRRELVVKGGEREQVHVALERPSVMAPVATNAVGSQPVKAERVPGTSSAARKPALIWAGGILLGVGVASELAGWILFNSRVDKGTVLLRSSDDDSAGSWEDARAPILGTGAAGGIAASAGTALLASAVPANTVPWWLAGTAGALGAGLLAWGSVDLARGKACDAGDARRCAQDEQRQDRGILLLSSSAPLLTLLVTKGVRDAIHKDARVDVALSLTGARVSGSW